MSESLHLNEQTSESCAAADSCEMISLENEQYYVESLDEDVVRTIETMNIAATGWAEIGKNISFFINDFRRSLETQASQSVTSREDRRNTTKGREQHVGHSISRSHNNAMKEIGTGVLEGIFVENLVADGAPSVDTLVDLENSILAAQREHINNVRTDRSFVIQDELMYGFQLEFLVRACMQSINQEAPEVLQALFEPSTLGDLPSSLKRVATLDINRGVSESVLLDNASKFAPGDQTKSAQLAEYIKANSLPESVKKSLQAIKLGMQSMGAPTCPFNDIGICTHLLAKIPDSQYPEDVQRDINTRHTTAAQKRTEALMSFAKRNPVSKILDSSIRLNDAMDFSGTPSKKRSPAPKLENKDYLSIEHVEVDTPSFTKVKFRLPNTDEIFEADTTDTDSVWEVVERLFEQKIISKYMNTYDNDDKLQDMVASALHVIATVPTYIGTDRTITPWLDKKKKAHLNEEGVKERFLRFSGSRAIGVSGGAIGKDTRIIFSQGTENGVRHITIHRVIHKSDIKSKVALH